MTDQHSIKVDWTTIGPYIKLSLERESDRFWIVTDQGAIYFRAESRDSCLRFMYAMEKQCGAIIDSLGREPQADQADLLAPVSSAGVGAEPASRPSNVVPLRRPTEPHEESA